MIWDDHPPKLRPRELIWATSALLSEHIASAVNNLTMKRGIKEVLKESRQVPHSDPFVIISSPFRPFFCPNWPLSAPFVIVSPLFITTLSPFSPLFLVLSINYGEKGNLWDWGGIADCNLESFINGPWIPKRELGLKIFSSNDISQPLWIINT